MTSHLTLSTLALLLAAPAFAAPSQLERAAGVAEGIYTPVQVGEIAAADAPAEALRLRKFHAAHNAGGVNRHDFAAPEYGAETAREGGSDRN